VRSMETRPKAGESGAQEERDGGSTNNLGVRGGGSERGRDAIEHHSIIIYPYAPYVVVRGPQRCTSFPTELRQIQRC
jgi:hypothetical protein